jgi:hypothetical protein
MATTIRLIRRPVRKGRGAGYPYAEVLSTLGTNRAVLYPGSGERLARAVASMRRHFYRKRYRLRSTPRSDGVALWIEPRNGAVPAA